MRRAVSFDCAGTLLDVAWDPAQIAMDCAEAIGLEPAEGAYSAYATALRSRWGEFCELNTLRSTEATDGFWSRMTLDWCRAVGIDESRAAELIAEADRRLYGPESSVFRLYRDTLPALEELRQAGARMAVLSNWDISLHKTLKAFGLDEHFEFAIASLEEGVEKPHPDLYALMVTRFGLEPSEILHVGDDPVADVQGARAAGCHAVLIDRDNPPAPGRISDLRQLKELPI